MRTLLIATSTVALALMLSSEAYPKAKLKPTPRSHRTIAESELNSPGTVPHRPVAQTTEPPTPIQSAEDAAVGEQLRDLLENKTQKTIPRQQDRAGVEAFYRKRGFARFGLATANRSPAPSKR